MVVPLLVALVVGYLLGSLPFGYLVARAHGVNIFEVGSRNPGATNVRRVLGPRPGNLVFALDALKGALATAWALLAFTDTVVTADFDGAWSFASFTLAGAAWTKLGVAGLIGALVGHSFSCFTGFRGGKGVATASGAFLVLMPVATAISAVVWTVTFFVFRYVSLASIVAAVALPLAAWGAGRPPLVIGIATAVALFVVLRHRSNITRLLAGTESKFQRRSSSPRSS
jgi:acyl phosphate:glycerol-3-phosphate acyltransferase